MGLLDTQQSRMTAECFARAKELKMTDTPKSLLEAVRYYTDPRNQVMTRKPEGHNEMESLLGKLVNVPKHELDQQVEKAKAKSKKRTKKPKKKS